MQDKTAVYRPFDGIALTVTGAESEAGVVGNIERTGGRYEEDVTALFRRVVGPDAVVVDAGANIGVLTLLAARLASRGHVYAFEPAPASVEYLRRNLADNGITNVTVEQAAVADAEGTLTFSYNEAYPAGSHVGKGVGSTIEVPATTIDAWASRRELARLDLLKIDVEGAEPMALDGAAETIARFRPVVVLECNAGALRRVARTSFLDLYDRLAGLYPTVAALSGAGALVPLRDRTHLELRMGHQGVVDLVAVPRGATVRERLAGAVDEARLRAVHNRVRPPRVNFVVTPDVGFEPLGEGRGAPGDVVRVPVRVGNRSRWWLSSAFVYEPVHVSYRIDGAEGHRTPFRAPLGPGRSAVVDVEVRLPDTPGRHRVDLTLVQESWAWLDDIDPACTAPLTAVVLG